jgi:myosin heavy subunit
VLTADGNQVQRSFHNTSPPKQPPHVYAVGENAYRALLTGDKRNQTIVITGER